MSEEELINEDLVDEVSLEEVSSESDVTDAINQLIGDWSYPGNFLSEIVIESGDTFNQVVARDLAEQHWSLGLATVQWDAGRIQIDISFDTGVSVGGFVSEDFTTIEWDNRTRWERR